MKTARWDELEILFGQAMALPSEERAAFLDEACRGDEALRDELDALLAHYQDAPGFFESLAGAMPPPAMPPDPNQPPPQDRDDPYDLSGSAVSHYRVLSKLGGGGMGVVYRAEDTRLKRTVALKFLSPHLSTDPQAKQRFVQEAQAASALDHVNICTIYEIGQTHDGRTFIAMACYEGETLKKKIARGPLPLAEALSYARQIAQGLERAHEAGIVHRDVKPANVMVTERGVVKLLDFGLAKMADVQVTRTGVTLGTVAYMSPEQARGEGVGHRTDVWSLGVLFYEMLTGVRPFKGEYEQAVIYSILHKDPSPLRTVNPEVPEALEHIVGMCLEKDPALRYGAMADLLADLEVLTEGAAAGESASLRTTLRRRTLLPRRAVVAGAGVLLALLLLLAIAPVRQAVLQGLGLPGTPAPMHLAVLPFTSPDADSSYQAFYEGLHLSMTNTLTQMKPYTGVPLRIVPASELGTVTTAEEARQRFGVRHVITGHVLHESEAVRLDLNLIDAERLDQVRATTVTAGGGEVASMQAGLIGGLADLLQIALPPQARRALTAGGTADSRAYAFYLEGRAFMERLDKPENIDTALRLFGYALEEDSLYALAHAGLGRAFLIKYEQTADSLWIARAEHASQRALALDDRLAESHLTLGRLYKDTGAYDEALRAYQLALALDPSDADAYLGMARAQERLQRAEEAEQTYLRGIAVRPDYHPLYNELGNFYLSNKRYKEAAAQYHKVIDLTPDNVWGYNNLGLAYLYQQRLDEARRWFDRSIGVRPNHLAYANLGLIAYREKRYRDEANMYERALALDSSNYLIWGNLARAYDRIPGERQQARAAYRRVIEKAEARYQVNPNDPQLVHSLARYYRAAGYLAYENRQYPEAVRLYRQALALDDQDHVVWDLLAEAYGHLPDQRDATRASRRRAVEAAEARRAETPNDADLLSRLAGYYVALGQPAAAVPILEQALAKSPEDASLMIRAGRLYEQMGDRDEALVWIEKALQSGHSLEEIEKDTVLFELRADPRFRRIQGRKRVNFP